MKRRLRLLIVLPTTIAMLISFGSGSVVASPPDTEGEVVLEVGTDGEEFDVGLSVQSDGTRLTVAELWLEVHTVLYDCGDFYSDQASFRYSPNKASASADLAGECWLHPNGQPFSVEFAVTVTALDLATEKARSRTNVAGEQCKVLEYRDDDIQSFAWELDIPEIPDLPDLNIVGTSGNFWSESRVCHQDPDPAQP